MPELPEVETVVRGLARQISGKKIIGVELYRKNLRYPFQRGFTALLQGSSVVSVERRAKYILINLSNGNTLIAHLGMTGSFRVEKKPAQQKHDHVVFNLHNNSRIVFNDPRRFGFMEIIKTADIAASKHLAHLGPEPFDKNLSAEDLYIKLQKAKGPVKPFIMRQDFLVGVGNIYASEALYAARIHPEQPAHTIPRPQFIKLLAEIKKVLQRAIDAGGSTLKDYKNAEGEMGYFQHEFAVYGRAGLPCGQKNCQCAKKGGIQKIIQAGRSSFFCPEKQVLF